MWVRFPHAIPPEISLQPQSDLISWNVQVEWSIRICVEFDAFVEIRNQQGAPVVPSAVFVDDGFTLRNVVVKAHFEVGRTHQTQWKCLVCTHSVVPAHLLSRTLTILRKVSVQSTPLLWHGMTRTYKMIEHDTLLHAISAGFRTNNQTMFTQTTLFRIVHSIRHTGCHTGSCYDCTVRWFSIPW